MLAAETSCTGNTSSSEAGLNTKMAKRLFSYDWKIKYSTKNDNQETVQNYRKLFKKNSVQFNSKKDIALQQGVFYQQSGCIALQSIQERLNLQ